MLVPVAGTGEFRPMRCGSIGNQKLIMTARGAEYVSRNTNNPVAVKAGSPSSEDRAIAHTASSEDMALVALNHGRPSSAIASPLLESFRCKYTISHFSVPFGTVATDGRRIYLLRNLVLAYSHFLNLCRIKAEFHSLCDVRTHHKLLWTTSNGYPSGSNTSAA